jgi:hypothetical protein
MTAAVEKGFVGFLGSSDMRSAGGCITLKANVQSKAAAHGTTQRANQAYSLNGRLQMVDGAFSKPLIEPICVSIRVEKVHR